MHGSGLTTFATAFLVVSMGSVTALMVWCFYRIMSEPDHSGPPDADQGEGGGGGKNGG